MFLTEFKVRNKYCIHNMGLAVLLFFFNLVVPINLTVRFTSMKWNVNLSNPESDNFNNLSNIIRENVRKVAMLSFCCEDYTV